MVSANQKKCYGLAVVDYSLSSLPPSLPPSLALCHLTDEDETLGGLYEAPPAPPAKPSTRVASPPAQEFSTPQRKTDTLLHSIISHLLSW